MTDFLLPEDSWPSSLPATHRAHLRVTIERFRAEPDLCGLAAAGSFVTGSMDVFSDLDLVVAVASPAWPNILARRQQLVSRVAPVLTVFTGEHVHEPRLLIVLHGPPLLHVDYKFVALNDVADRVEDPVILWERDDALSRAFTTRAAHYPLPEPQWLEDRFWAWIHYFATKAARREVFELLDGLAFLRKRVFGPLLLAPTSFQPSGVRRLEQARPDAIVVLAEATASYDLVDAVRAVHASVRLYRSLRPLDGVGLQYRGEAEAMTVAYLADVSAALGVHAP